MAIWATRSIADGGVFEISAMEEKSIVEDELPRPHNGRQIVDGRNLQLNLYV